MSQGWVKGHQRLLFPMLFLYLCCFSLIYLHSVFSVRGKSIQQLKRGEADVLQYRHVWQQWGCRCVLSRHTPSTHIHHVHPYTQTGTEIRHTSATKIQTLPMASSFLCVRARWGSTGDSIYIHRYSVDLSSSWAQTLCWVNVHGPHEVSPAAGIRTFKLLRLQSHTFCWHKPLQKHRWWRLPWSPQWVSLCSNS